MALKIRLRQQGRTNAQTYRLVVTDIRAPRDGKYLEMVGWYQPMASTQNVSVDADRIRYWVSLGAQLSESVEHLIRKTDPELMQFLSEKKANQRVKKVQERKRRSEKA